MNIKLLIILIATVIFTTLNLFLKLLGYSFKAKNMVLGLMLLSLVIICIMIQK